jgi:hypothetical protein
MTPVLRILVAGLCTGQATQKLSSRKSFVGATGYNDILLAFTKSKWRYDGLATAGEFACGVCAAPNQLKLVHA